MPEAEKVFQMLPSSRTVRSISLRPR